MEKTEKDLHKYGLVGKNISYSFSRGYFAKKFEKLNLHNCSYVNFDIATIEEFKSIVKDTKNLKGLNVTIPYKRDIIPLLSNLDDTAAKIGAVNTIKIAKGKLTGYNTDAYGFQKSLEPSLQRHHKKALILGTGGASKAVAYVFDQLQINYIFVSRSAKSNCSTYADLSKKIINDYLIIVNCTPLGTFPDIEKKPDIPYQFLSPKHLLFDLIYNPEKTAFLKEGEEKGATIINGYRMLELQAEKAWEIWNS